MAEIDQQNDQTGDETLIAALAAGQTVRDAAATAGVSESTAFRRLRDAAVRERISEARARLFDQTLGRLADAATEAVGALRALLSEQSAMVRLGAARAILEHSTRLREHVELEARMQEIEHRIGCSNGHGVL
jgi:hypothetical protein